MSACDPAVRLLGRCAVGPDDYRHDSILPHSTAAIFAAAGARRRADASTSVSARVSCSPLMGEAGADVVGVDWRIAAGPGRAVAPGRGRATGVKALQGSDQQGSDQQGSVLQGSDQLGSQVSRSQSSRGHIGMGQTSRASPTSRGHVFNLGHGVLQGNLRSGPARRRAGPAGRGLGARGVDPAGKLSSRAGPASMPRPRGHGRRPDPVGASGAVCQNSGDMNPTTTHCRTW